MRDHLLEHDVDPGAQVLELPLDGVKFLAQGLFADPGHGLHRRVGFHSHHRRLFIQLAGIIQQTPTHLAYITGTLRNFYPERNQRSIDMEVCERCGGRVKVVTSIEDSAVIAYILKHLKHKVASARPTNLPIQPLERGPPQAGLFD